MLKNKSTRIIGIVMCIVFGITFSIGVFSNPNFNIYDFCMNLSSEILGIAITLVLVDTYVRGKEKEKEARRQAREEKQA